MNAADTWPGTAGNAERPSALDLLGTRRAVVPEVRLLLTRRRVTRAVLEDLEGHSSSSGLARART